MEPCGASRSGVDREHALPADDLFQAVRADVVQGAPPVAGAHAVIAIAFQVAHDHPAPPQLGQELGDRDMMRLLQVAAADPQIEQVAQQHDPRHVVGQVLQKREERSDFGIAHVEMNVADERQGALVHGRASSSSVA